MCRLAPHVTSYMVSVRTGHLKMARAYLGVVIMGPRCGHPTEVGLTAGPARWAAADVQLLEGRMQLRLR